MLAFTCLSPIASATEPEVKAPVKVMPSADFLTFLADMKKVNGKWVSPIDLQEEPSLPIQPQVTKNVPLKADIKAKVIDGKSTLVKPEPKS